MAAGETAVPVRLRDLAQRPCPAAQRGIQWPRGTWQRTLPSQAALFNGLPGRLDRKAVRAVCEAPRGEEDALRGFLAAMAWGYGRSGYGPWRVSQTLTRADLPAVLLEAARLSATDTLAAYLHLATHRAPHLGPAFGTKYLYFATPETSASPLILDRLVASWIRTHAGVTLNPVPWSHRTYSRYMALMAAWSAALNVIPAKVEELIFRDTAGGQWTDPLICR